MESPSSVIHTLLGGSFYEQYVNDLTIYSGLISMYFTI